MYRVLKIRTRELTVCVCPSILPPQHPTDIANKRLCRSGIRPAYYLALCIFMLGVHASRSKDSKGLNLDFQPSFCKCIYDRIYICICLVLTYKDYRAYCTAAAPMHDILYYSLSAQPNRLQRYSDAD